MSRTSVSVTESTWFSEPDMVAEGASILRWSPNTRLSLLAGRVNRFHCGVDTRLFWQRLTVHRLILSGEGGRGVGLLVIGETAIKRRSAVQLFGRFVKGKRRAAWD